MTRISQEPRRQNYSDIIARYQREVDKLVGSATRRPSYEWIARASSLSAARHQQDTHGVGMRTH